MIENIDTNTHTFGIIKTFNIKTTLPYMNVKGGTEGTLQALVI